MYGRGGVTPVEIRYLAPTTGESRGCWIIAAAANADDSREHVVNTQLYN